MTSAKKNPALAATSDRAVIEAVEANDNPETTATGLSPQAKWDAANPKAKWAHQALRSAEKKGLIERGPCEECGAVHGVDGAVIHGHHDDYDKPMAVRWLCILHHRQLHAAERAEAGGE